MENRRPLIEALEQSTISRKGAKAQRRRKSNSLNFFANLCGFVPLRDVFLSSRPFFTPSYGGLRWRKPWPLTAAVSERTCMKRVDACGTMQVQGVKHGRHRYRARCGDSGGNPLLSRHSCSISKP